MARKNDKTINVRLSLEVEDVTQELFEQMGIKLDNNLEIAFIRLPNSNYGYYNFYVDQLIFEFTKIEKLMINDNHFVIKNANGNFRLLYINPTEGSISCSTEFKSLIKEFNKVILVKDMEDNRMLIKISDENDYISCLWHEESLGYSNYAVVQLPNLNYVVLKRDGLIYCDYEFVEYHKFLDEKAKVSGQGICVKSPKSNCYSIIRIDDLQVFEGIQKIDVEIAVDGEEYLIIQLSNEYKHFLHSEDIAELFNSFFDGEEHAFLKLNDNKKHALFRVSDFEVSDEYDFMYYIANSKCILARNESNENEKIEVLINILDFKKTEEYSSIDTNKLSDKGFAIAVTKDNKSVCIRISDFKVATFN